MVKRILIIYETAGGGHYANAKAIERAIHLRYPECVVDLMHVSKVSQSKRVTHMYNSYNELLKADPRMVSYGFRMLNSFNAEQVLSPLVPKAFDSFKTYMYDKKPDIVLSVFSVFNYIAYDLMQKLGWAHEIPFVIFVTDLTRNFLKSWVHPDADLMIAMLDETRAQLVDYGMPADRIQVLNGMPVNPTFVQGARTKEEARRELGMAVDRFTVLVTMGGVANKNAIRFSKELAESGLPLQLVVVCGRNAGLKRQMDRVAARARIPIKVLGFTDQMPLLMDAADAAVSKPGPGTIAELAYKKLPMLIDDLFPPMPQEQGNLDFVVEKGIGKAITPSRGVVELIRELMESPSEYQRMVDAMEAIRNPEAVYQLVEMILSAKVAAPREA